MSWKFGQYLIAGDQEQGRLFDYVAAWLREEATPLLMNKTDAACSVLCSLPQGNQLVA